MRLGPFRIRIGVISSEDDSLNLVNELMRSTISTGSMASCSFYVPLLTPIAFVVFCNTAEKRGSVLVRFRSGSRIDEDSFQWDESSVRVYGELAHVTGFEGKDIKLLATEETIKIDLIDETDGELMASFRYKHLEPSEVSQDTNLALVDYSNDNGLKSIEGVFNDENSLPPSPALDAQANASEDKRKEGSDQYGSDVGSSDEEDMEITHSKIVFRGHGLLAPATGSNLSTPEKKKRRPSSQLTPLRQTKLSKSFTPSVKASSSHGRTISNIKAEDSDLKPLPRFDPSPSLQLIKDSQKKVAGLDGQIDRDEIELEGLEDKRLVKINRAKSNYEKALLKADREYSTDRARIEEHIEEALNKRQEEIKKQEWLQAKAMENVDVIELSDDSASESGTVSSDDE